MKDILARENYAVLAQLVGLRVIVAFDFDGTLAPIVPQRDAARMRERTESLLARVCDLYPCAIISGRSHRDVATRLGKAWAKYVVGNHGLEPGSRLDEFEREVRQARASLETALAGRAGVEVEDKRYSLAVHYRSARRRAQVHGVIRQAVSSLPTSMRAVAGNLVVNVLPARAPNKGDALVELREAERADAALYVGGDDTDEDVFRLAEPSRLVGVRVGGSSRSGAAYFIRSQRDVDRLLLRLIALRQSKVGRA